MKRQPINIEKPTIYRIHELIYALHLVYESAQNIRIGKRRYLPTVAGQLRSLLVEKSRKAESLLISMASIFEYDLKMYCGPDVSDAKPSNLPKPVLEVSGFPISFNQQSLDQTKITIDDLLNRQIIEFKGNFYTVQDVITTLANKAGGSHYSKNIPEDFVALLHMNLMNNVNLLSNLVVQISEATASMGLQFLKSIIDYEMHLIMALPPNVCLVEEGLNIVFDAKNKFSPMRITIGLTQQLAPNFIIHDIQGNAVSIISDHIIKWNDTRHIQASFRLQPDFSTIVELVVDGKVVGSQIIPEPIYVLSHLGFYEVCHNKLVDGDPQPFSFALSRFAAYTSEMTNYEIASVQEDMEKEKNNKNGTFVFYKPNSYGHARNGDKLEMTGKVEHVSFNDLMK